MRTKLKMSAFETHLQERLKIVDKITKSWVEVTNLPVHRQTLSHYETQGGKKE